MIHQMGEVTSSERVDIGCPMDFWEQERLVPVSCSQTSNVSDSWILDNTPLLAACDQDNDLAWKYQISSQPTPVGYLGQISDSQVIATMATNLSSLTDDALVEDLAFITTAALSPVSNPPASPGSSSEDTDIIIVPETQVNSQTIMAELDEWIQKPQPIEKSIQEIEMWLKMTVSSQGNEFLSVEKINDVNDVKTEQTVEIPAGVAMATDGAVAVKTTSKRKSCGENGTKKRNQNKEAARRYRDRKKTEAEEFASKKAELMEEHKAVKKALKVLHKNRVMYLNLIEKTFNNRKNPCFSVHFPSWHNNNNNV